MEDIENWLLTNLFADEFFFSGAFFPCSTVLFSRLLPSSLIEYLVHSGQAAAPFQRADLYPAIMKACSHHSIEQDANLFHANLHDNIAWVLEYTANVRASHVDWSKTTQKPQLPDPTWDMYNLMENREAQEGGTTYVGLLGRNKDWLLFLEKGNEDISISFHGLKVLCESVRDNLQLPTTQT